MNNKIKEMKNNIMSECNLCQNVDIDNKNNSIFLKNTDQHIGPYHTRKHI